MDTTDRAADGARFREHPIVRQPDIAIIDAGLKALSTEFGTADVVPPEGWCPERLTEEHDFLWQTDRGLLWPGNVVEVVPSHDCTTINLHGA